MTIDTERERGAFEKWYETNHYPFKDCNWFRKDGGAYELEEVDWAWCGWLGRAKAESK